MLKDTLISIKWEKKMKTDKDSSQVNIGDVKGGIHDSTFAGRDVIKNIKTHFEG